MVFFIEKEITDGSFVYAEPNQTTFCQLYLKEMNMVNELVGHNTETCFLFTIFVPMYRPRSISCIDLGLFILYLSDRFFILIFIFIMSNCIIS